MTHEDAMATCRRIVEARAKIKTAKRWNDRKSIEYYTRELNDEIQSIDIETFAHAVLGLEVPS